MIEKKGILVIRISDMNSQFCRELETTHQPLLVAKLAETDCIEHVEYWKSTKFGHKKTGRLRSKVQSPRGHLQFYYLRDII